ncbi:hypothetical protein SH139x_005699 [Planctomycetaceae bacterium SH139]
MAGLSVNLKDLQGAPWEAQAMMLAGIGLMIWVLFRRHLKLRARSRAHDRQHQRQQVEQRRLWETQTKSGAPLADAPIAVARWQAGMFDLQRDLKAELETKIAVLQSVVRQADQRIAQLGQLQAANFPATHHAGLSSEKQGQPVATVGTSATERPLVTEQPVRTEAASLARQAEEVRQLSASGMSLTEIADRLGISLGDAEFLQGIG